MNEPAPMIRRILADDTLAAARPTARVQVREITMAPKLAAGRHVHNGPVFGRINRGSVDFRVAGEAGRVLFAGETFYEPAGVVIESFDALTDGVEFVAWFLLDTDQESSIEPPAEAR